MKKYFQSVGADVPSGVVVFLIAIPLCLGIAVASGLNEFSGIIGGVIGGIVIGMMSGSHLSVSGPAAGLTAIVAAAVLKLPVVEAFFLAVVLSGIFQVIMGVFKLGIIGDYIPNSVIKGMLAAIGIILILKQFPYLIGVDGANGAGQLSGDSAFPFIQNSFNNITPIALIIGIGGLGILILYETKWIKKKKFFQLLSGPLVVVLMGILLNYFLSNTGNGETSKSASLVNIPVATSTAEFLSFFQFPDWSFIFNPDVWITAITIALVASLETLLGLEAVDKLDPLKRVSPPNRELIAQGSGNIISGLLGGLPLTSVIVRSSANVNAGAKTKMSAIFHGILIFSCVAFVPGILNLIPKAALAAILVFTGYKLTKASLFKTYYQKGWEQFMPFIITVVAIVSLDLLKGVLIGIAVGIFYVIRSNFRTAIFSVSDNNHHLIRLRKDVSFFSKPHLKASLERLPQNASVILDLTRAEFIDQDLIDTINDFMQHASLKNITVTLKRSMHNLSHRLVDINQNHEDDSAH